VAERHGADLVDSQPGSVERVEERVLTRRQHGDDPSEPIVETTAKLRIT
jgi:hypothetical protein